MQYCAPQFASSSSQPDFVLALHFPPHAQVAERIASSSIGFGNPVRARGTPGTIAAQSAALRQV